MSFTDEEIDRQIRWMLLKLEPHIKEVLERLAGSLDLRLERVVSLAIQVETIDKTIRKIFNRLDSFEDSLKKLESAVNAGITIQVVAKSKPPIAATASMEVNGSACDFASDFSTRVGNALRFNKIVDLGALKGMTENELLSLPNFGPRSLFEVKYYLAERGLRLAGDR